MPFQGAIKRLRSKFMTMAVAFRGSETDAGSEMMKHIAATMIGGISTSFLLGSRKPGTSNLLWSVMGLSHK
jgi:Cu/Ag efflux pump CusA